MNDVVDEKNVRLCKGCGKKIFFATTDEGKKIPLDVAAPVYFLWKGGRIVRDRSSFVTHFATCSTASDFSGSRKKSG